MADYIPNDEAAAIAADLIPKYHPRLSGLKISHLLNVKQPPKPTKKPKKQPRQGKKITIAKCSKVSKKTQALAEQDIHFVIEYDSLIWDAMDIKQKTATVDHELGHAGSDADGTYMINHEIEDFGFVLRRYGFWKSDIEKFAQTVIEVYNRDHSEDSVEQCQSEGAFSR